MILFSSRITSSLFPHYQGEVVLQPCTCVPCPLLIKLARKTNIFPRRGENRETQLGRIKYQNLCLRNFLSLAFTSECSHPLTRRRAHLSHFPLSLWVLSGPRSGRQFLKVGFAGASSLYTKDPLSQFYGTSNAHARGKTGKPGKTLTGRVDCTAHCRSDVYGSRFCPKKFPIKRSKLGP